jgi:transcriptional regulatory protein RtcR
MRSTVAIGLVGSVLDAGKGTARWEHWRPSVGLCQQEALIVRRFELLHQSTDAGLAETVAADVRSVSPETEVRLHAIDLRDAWDFEEVYGALHDFVGAYAFDTEREDYLVHITTGTHVAQICLFLLAESRRLPGKLVQTSPRPTSGHGVAGSVSIIDLDLSRYDRIASRFRLEEQAGVSFLKGGIDTRNRAFNELIERIERVAIASREPILLMGPTGAGKSRLARRVYALKRSRRQLAGEFVEVNCAVLRGDAAMSALFGHVKGAFTGALAARDGLLRRADGGLLLLDEIGELGLDEQAMLLRAIEEGVFRPMGSDAEVRTSFQLIAGTNRDLRQLVREGRFREDLLARIDLWTFRLPGLRARPEDVEPNFDYELARFAERSGPRVTANREARTRFLRFAASEEALWSGNFRDLAGAVARMATMAAGGRISVDVVEDEIARLRESWAGPPAGASEAILEEVLGPDRLAALDRFDRVQLADVVAVCRSTRSLSEAGRLLYTVSRSRRKATNDADRLRKYLARFGLAWRDLAPRT